jgi:hypothetical protein
LVHAGGQVSVEVVWILKSREMYNVFSRPNFDTIPILKHNWRAAIHAQDGLVIGPHFNPH